jgi:predicted transcriptional regulator
MTKLARREEQIMKVFWDLKKAFIRDVIPHLPDPNRIIIVLPPW